MNLSEILKQLKAIKPDGAYARRSRMMLVGDMEAVLPRLSFWRVMSHSVQFAAAVALTGLLLVVGIGGFSLGKFLSPFGLRSLDTASLRVEAEAVDAQIELTTIAYVPDETVGAASGAQALRVKRRSAMESASGTAASSTPAPTIEEILDALAE